MNFWKKKKTNHHHHHHHRENVSDNISIGREEKRERERERLAHRSRSRKKVSTTTTTTHPTRPLALLARREKKRENFRIRRTKKKKRFPRFAKWEKDAHLAPATTSGFCRRSRRFSRGFFLDVLVREPFRGRRASRALPFAHCIKSQSVLRQRQPVSLVLILRSPLLSFFLSFVHTNNNSLALLLFFFVHNVNPHDFANDGADPFLCAFVVLSNAFHV